MRDRLIEVLDRNKCSMCPLRECVKANHPIVDCDGHTMVGLSIDGQRQVVVVDNCPARGDQPPKPKRSGEMKKLLGI